MVKILYDVRKDAIKKLKTANEDDSVMMLDAIGRLKEFSDVAQEDGLLSLPLAVKGEKSAYLRIFALMIADGISPEYLIDIGTYEYWIQNPQGIEAILYYIYLQGMLYIQEGIGLKEMELSFRTLVPEKWRVTYYERFGDKLDDTLWYRKIEESFSNLHPVFEKKELAEKISILQEKVKKLDNNSLWNILWETHNDVLIRCVYGFSQEARERIINYLGKAHGKLIIKDTVRLAETELKEMDVLDAVVKMDYIVEKMINGTKDIET